MEFKPNLVLLVLLCLRLLAEAESTAVTTLNKRDREFIGEPEVLFFSPSYSETKMTCSGNPCRLLACASACAEKNGCAVFSHCSSNGTCIHSRRSDGDDYRMSGMVGWNTYYSSCPVDKGYGLYMSVTQRMMCLRLGTDKRLQEDAKQLCEQDEANLVRVKTLDVYALVRDILVEAALPPSEKVWVGADDREVEGEFWWNDGTRLQLGTSMWLNSVEGYEDGEDCVSISSNELLHDVTCLPPARFVCQYDV